MTFYFAWDASGKQLTLYGQGWLAEPVLWWLDIYMLDAAFSAAERKLDGKGSGPRLPMPDMDIEDLARGE